MLAGVSGGIGAIYVGGNVNNGSVILARVGNIASLTVKGSVQNTNVVGLTAVGVTGNGNIGPVLIYGNVSGDVNQDLQSDPPTGSEIGIGGAGNITSLYVIGSMENGAQIGIMGSGGGRIGPVTIGANLGNGSAITSQVQDSNGNIGAVTVTGNVNNGGVVAPGGAIGAVIIRGAAGMIDGGQIIADTGITSLDVVTGSLGSGAASASIVQVNDTGSIGTVTIGGNMDNALLETSTGNIGFVNLVAGGGIIKIGGSVEDGGSIITTQGSIAELNITGNLGSGAATASLIEVNGTGIIGPVRVGGNMDNAQIDTSTGNIGTFTATANNGTVYITGSMEDGSAIDAGVLGSIDIVSIGGDFGTSPGSPREPRSKPSEATSAS